jgi:predicted metal-binding protein
MNDADLEKYSEEAVERGATHAKQIHPSSVVTAPWVRWKCQYGCRGYGRSYCCPPDTSTPEQTRTLIDSFHRAILFHIEAPMTPDRGKSLSEYLDMLIDLEGEGVRKNQGRTLHIRGQSQAFHGRVRDRRLSDSTEQWFFY